MDEACVRVSLKHASLWDEIFKKIEAEGVADGHDSAGKRVDRGRGGSMFQGRCGLKYSRKLALKGMQMAFTGGKGGSCGWTEAVYEACFRVSLKHVSLWDEIFRRLRLKGLQMEMILGKGGVVVGGQRSWTKHASGLVSNMLRCGLKYSGN